MTVQRPWAKKQPSGWCRPQPRITCTSFRRFLMESAWRHCGLVMGSYHDGMGSVVPLGNQAIHSQAWFTWVKTKLLPSAFFTECLGCVLTKRPPPQKNPPPSPDRIVPAAQILIVIYSGHTLSSHRIRADSMPGFELGSSQQFLDRPQDASLPKTAWPDNFFSSGYSIWFTPISLPYPVSSKTLSRAFLSLQLFWLNHARYPPLGSRPGSSYRLRAESGRRFSQSSAALLAIKMLYPAPAQRRSYLPDKCLVFDKTDVSCSGWLSSLSAERPR